MQELSNTHNNISDRLLLFVNSQGISKYKFHKKIGVSNGFIDKATEIRTDNLRKIIDNYPILNLDWLLYGRGEMLNSNKPLAVPTDLSSGIPLISIDVAAGFGKGEITLTENNVESRFVIPEWNDKQVDYLIRISGSSMYPKYSNGDLIACRKINDTSFFQWGKVYVLDTDQGPMIKRLFQCDDTSCLLCKSDNVENYPPFTISKDSIYSISVVVGVIRSE